ncbi:glutamate racemase [Rubeoparvulum massiliense]|uniref:glutamate racemase n=1 Tax=Rubeoparvulum massiliense TaxID=1631346 RepID=UPI00065DE7A4|nr:glutamate racemase [Rubeoparvulum massiliense]
MEGKRIGILDSGVGGLTVVREVFRQLPKERVVYFGDNARCPYGPRPGDEVRDFTLQMAEYLLQYDLKMLVIACNTATALALDYVKDRLPVPVIGVIGPGSRAAIKATAHGRIGIIGTINTVNSEAYPQHIHKINPSHYVKSLACPTLVPLVEQGGYKKEEALEEVRTALQSLQGENLDTLILGCTHYPLLQPVIHQIMGEQVTLIDSAEETAREISTVLYQLNQLEEAERNDSHLFFTSGDPKDFEEIAVDWLGTSVIVKHHHF